ncbi:unnamed protein product [Coccothraustes coccothraustes]
MTRLLARPPACPPACLRLRYGAVRGQRRQQRTRCFVEGRGQAAAGPHFQAGTFYSLSAGEKTFQKGWGGGKQGPAGCARPPRRLRGGGGGRPGAEACAPPVLQGPSARGQSSGAAAEEGSGRLAPPSPGDPGSSAAALPCVHGAEMEFLTLSPPLLNL